MSIDIESCPLRRDASQSSRNGSSPKRIRRDMEGSIQPYKNNQHINFAFNAINTMRKQNLFCDVILQADGGPDIEAHRMILAACSPYFYNMFTKFEERDQPRIKLPGVNHFGLEILIDYIYTTEVLITEENVQILLPTANLLQLTDVRDACWEFLQHQLHPSNCLGIRDFADTHGCSALVEYADNYIEQHFPEFAKGVEFLTLPLENVMKLISTDHLAVPSEKTIFECVISWVNADLETRQIHLEELMEHVRLPLLSQEYLFERVEKEPLITSNPNCQRFLVEALSYHHSLKNEEKNLSETTRTKFRESNLPKILLVVGDDTLDSCRNVEYFDFNEEKWYQVSQLPSKRKRAGLTVLGERVYVVGGCNGSFDSLRTVDVYDGNDHEWSLSAEMKICRFSHGVAVLRNCIYAVGGNETMETGLNSAEVYDPWNNEWRLISPMLTKRSGLGVGVVDGILYAVGGFDDRIKALSSVECYDPRKNEWRLVAGMSTQRADAGVGVLDGFLYAVGGCNKQSIMKSVEVYNPRINRWKKIPDMVNRRRYAAVIAFDGKLYVVGGQNESCKRLASVEIYTPKTNSWMTLSSSMSIPRINAGVAIIDKSRAPIAPM